MDITMGIFFTSFSILTELICADIDTEFNQSKSELLQPYHSVAIINAEKVCSLMFGRDKKNSGNLG
jgi:hypothetical protein